MPGQPDWTSPATSADIAQVIANTGGLKGPFVSAAVSVGTVPTLLRTAAGIEGVIIYNPSTTVTVWIGEASIAAGSGIPCLPGNFVSYGLNGSSLYGIVASGTVTVNVQHSPVG